MASSDSGKVKRVVLLALVCAGCAAAPVIALREAPLEEPIIAPELRTAAAVTTPAVPEPEIASPASAPPAIVAAEAVPRPAPEPNLNERLRGMAVG